MLGFMIESLVAVLLLVTIGYCMVLNGRLKRLRADESSLRETIGELVRATQIAERAIDGLKETASECDRDLTNKLRQADRFSRSIEKQIELGGKVLNRLARISELARGHGLVERGTALAKAPGANPAEARQSAAPVGRAQAPARAQTGTQTGTQAGSQPTGAPRAAPAAAPVAKSQAAAAPLTRAPADRAQATRPPGPRIAGRAA